METNILCLSELTFHFLLQPSQPLTFETLQALLKCQNMKYKNKDGIFNRHTADLSLVSSPVGRHPSGRSVSQVSSQFALRRWLTARLVACDSVTSPLPTAKRTPVRPVAVGSRSQVPLPGLPQFCEDRNNASHLSASRTPDALRRRCFTHAGGRSHPSNSGDLQKTQKKKNKRFWRFTVEKSHEKQQPFDRSDELLDIPGLNPYSGGRDMAEQQSQQHRLHEVPSMAAHNHRGGNHGGFSRRFCWGLLQKHFSHGSGRPVLNRAYSEYYLQDYTGWLEERVTTQSYWSKISSCVRDSHVCGKMGRSVNGIPETADMFNLRKLSPIQSGCCKPPTACGYIYGNETYWTPGTGLIGADPDCARWSNDQEQLCYNCNSCKAGVLASLKKSWRKVSVINIVILIFLVIMYVVACAAFRHNKRMDNDEPYGETRMEKAQPSRIHF
nr:tetraspanin-3-like [Ipomoea batatas]